ncbi:GLPGLI family protein [Mucilaginibacter pineti]|uniref:GLPGLI family protein n=1 Tax=Mucilaginibacter pineti TaxID=1391627 RepID=A0A1G7HU93_9SPHI|nr:hypothetical protein [Mucilaginibacter pineti]SDF03629.1 GLPGLI family protein [Mucilaginibacter pineti]
MNIKFFNVALGLALTATAMSASAQKKISEGVINLEMSIRGQAIPAQNYFRSDSSAYKLNFGPAAVKILNDAAGKSFANVVEVPAFGVKKAAIATPDEVDQMVAAFPVLEFTPTTETKQISGFNCKKVIAKDTKKGATYDIWITNDIEVPFVGLGKYYAKIGGFPVQYTSFSAQGNAEVTVKSVVEQKVPAGTFGIPADFDRISLDDLAAMQKGGGQ